MNWTEVNASAQALLGQGRVEPAVKQWSALATQLGEQGLWAEACAIGRTLLSITEGSACWLQGAALYVMAETTRGAGDLSEAEQWGRRALEAHERAGVIRAMAADWELLGELAEERGDVRAAIDCWEHALELLDRDTTAEVAYELLFALATAYSELAEVEQVEQCLARAERRDAGQAA